MLLRLDNNELQPSLESLHCTSTDEFSDIMPNMIKSLHVNSPEQTICNMDFDNENENKLSRENQLIEQLQAQLVHIQMERTQPRDYTRILSQSETPANWYKAVPASRSVYFYDPNCQQHVENQSMSPRKTKPIVPFIAPESARGIQGRLINHSNFGQHDSLVFTPRKKYMLQIYNTAFNYNQQKQRSNQSSHSAWSAVSQQPLSISSGLQSTRTLPSINRSKQQRGELLNPSVKNEHADKLNNTIEKQPSNHQPINTEPRKKNYPIVMPPTL